MMSHCFLMFYWNTAMLTLTYFLSPFTRKRFVIKSIVTKRLACKAEHICSLALENLGVPLEGDRDVGELCGSHQGWQVPFRTPIPKVGLLLRRCSGTGLHLALTGEPRGFSRGVAGFSNYDGEFRMPLVLAQGSPIFHLSCEGKLGISLEWVQGQ